MKNVNKVKKLFIVISLLTLVFILICINLPLISAEDSSTREISGFSCENFTDKEFKLYSLKGDSYYKRNTCNLQKEIDRVSQSGGGEVRLPAGTYYFAPKAVNGAEAYVIKCKDNVSLIGAGMNEETGTVLKPIGNLKSQNNETLATDMFYFNDYADSGFTSRKYLVNADFSNFVIDGSEAYTKDFKIWYNSAGKGFMINLFQDCDWDSVMVKNTFGTGFGMDMPINSTIKNCIAVGNGAGAYYGSNFNAQKDNIEDAPGASGFGIGAGLSNSENILIENCTSIGNAKYGFFFEHQNRFGNHYDANSSKGFKVRNSTSVGNMYNFGGEKGYDVTYENCKSYGSSSNYPNEFKIKNLNPLGNENRLAYNMGTNTRRIYFVNSTVDSYYTNIASSSSYYYPTRWAQDRAILHTGSHEAIDINQETTRARAITFLWRYSGFLGDVLGYREELKTGFTDVDNNANEYKHYLDAIKWAKDNGINNGTSSNTFEPDEGMRIVDFLVALWRYDGKKIVSCTSKACDISSSEYYSSAVYWAYANDIITTADLNTVISNKNKIIKDGDLIKYLYNYNKKQLEVTSSEYLIERENDKFIYTGSQTNTTTILSNIKNTIGQKELIGNRLIIKKDGVTLATFKIINISSRDYWLADHYIYTGTDTFNLSNVTVNNGSKESSKGMVKIKYNGIVLDQFQPIRLADSSLKLDKNKNLLLGIKEGQKVNNLINKVSLNTDVSVVNANGNHLSSDILVGTGDKLKIKLGDSTIEHTLVVLGDVTGDGKVNVTDVGKLYRYLKGRITMEDCYIAAGNVVSTDDVIKVTDVGKLYRYIKGRIDSLE